MQQTMETEVEAAQVRVTPEELAQATALIEARREAEARRREAEAKHLAGTIALGEAVQTLGLPTTPEELYAEVQVLRAKAQQSHARTQTKREHTSKNGTAEQFAWAIAISLCLTLPLCAVFAMCCWPHTASQFQSSTSPVVSTPASTSTGSMTAVFQPLQPSFLSATPAMPTTLDIDRSIFFDRAQERYGMFHSLDVQEGKWTACGTNAMLSLARREPRATFEYGARRPIVLASNAP